MKCLPYLLLAAGFAGCSPATSDAAAPDDPAAGDHPAAGDARNDVETGDVAPPDDPSNGESSDADAPAASLFTVDVYDPARDASADLKATIARAGEEKKRILLDVGGDW